MNVIRLVLGHIISDHPRLFYFWTYCNLSKVDQMLLFCVAQFAGEIVKTMLKLTELARDPLSPTSQTVSLHEVRSCWLNFFFIKLINTAMCSLNNINQQISQNLSVTPKMEKAQIVQYLSLLTDEKVRLLSKICQLSSFAVLLS